MNTSVTRHAFSVATAEMRANKLTESAHSEIESLEHRPDAFNLALGTSLLAAKTHCAYDPRAAQLPTWEAWVTSMQVGSAMFAAAVTQEASAQCRIADKVRSIPATGPQHYTDAENWLTAFWLAVICREQDRMTQLMNVPLSLLRASGAAYDDFVYSWIEALQTAWRQGGDLGPLLTAAMNGSEPSAVSIADPDLVQKIWYPPINLFFLYVTREPGQFNEALADALRWHKSYWTHDEDLAIESSGLVALGPLAMACLAYDANMPIEVESEYLPKHLLQRSWLGEFDT
ncbi:immunity 49 family protein [Streptomyces sp. NPDC002851]